MHIEGAGEAAMKQGVGIVLFIITYQGACGLTRPPFVSAQAWRIRLAS